MQDRRDSRYLLIGQWWGVIDNALDVLGDLCRGVLAAGLNYRCRVAGALGFAFCTGNANAQLGKVLIRQGKPALQGVCVAQALPAISLLAGGDQALEGVVTKATYSY
jgi:hypothetical protein